MEYLISTFGAKFCCIFASTCGGFTNVLVKKKWNWSALKDILLAVIVGFISAEFLIPAAMSYWKFGPEVAIGLAFLLGYAGIRLLPKIEEIVTTKLSK